MASIIVPITLTPQDQVDFQQLGLDAATELGKSLDTVRKAASDQRVLYINTALNNAQPLRAAALSMILRTALDNYQAQN